MPVRSTADRIARMKARMDEQARRAELTLATAPSPVPEELVRLASAALRAALPPDASTPRDILAIEHLEAVARLSREGMSVREIARTVGLSYNHTSRLRARLGIARSRRRPRR